MKLLRRIFSALLGSHGSEGQPSATNDTSPPKSKTIILEMNPDKDSESWDPYDEDEDEDEYWELREKEEKKQLILFEEWEDARQTNNPGLAKALLEEMMMKGHPLPEEFEWEDPVIQLYGDDEDSEPLLWGDTEEDDE